MVAWLEAQAHIVLSRSYILTEPSPNHYLCPHENLGYVQQAGKCKGFAQLVSRKSGSNCYGLGAYFS